MAKKKMWRRMLGLALSVIMLLSLALPAFATGADNGAISLKQVDNSVISAGLNLRRPDNKLEQEEAHFGNVRVSIVLEDKSTIEAGYSVMNIADNASAMAYRANLENKQDQMARAISAQALGGAQLDVVWNLTLAANIISANVPYQKIDDIKAIPGVADVVIETRYEPAVVSKGGDDPNMATSSEMIGSPVAYGLQYTGAGSRIAIIDTGTDTDHQSFDGKAYEEAIIGLANAKLEEGEPKVETFEAAVTALGLDLLDKAEIAELLANLHISKDKGMPTNLTADKLYLNSKLPFAFNYVDKDLDITHDNDAQGEHGSHVAGIATANSLIKKGDGYAKALNEVAVQGVAPEAQLITMKVFGKGGGAYDSDYMVAIEDAIILKCDAINLSLGSAAAGAPISAAYQSIMDSLAEKDVVVVMSAGNAGTWADNILGVGLPYLYADDVNLDTVGSPGSFKNSLAVASVDNTGSTGNYVEVGGNRFGYNDSYDSGYGNKALTTLDTKGTGTEYDYIFSATLDADGKPVFGIGAEEEVAAIGAANLNGKIFICQRGTTSFFEKANAAAGAGAAGTIIWNNQDGVIGLNLTGYEYTAPCVSILQADGLAIFEKSTPVTDADGKVLYYTGKMTITSTIGVISGKPDFYTMSSFSSWGVPGDLSLKPEITAPGGSIYSVNGLPASGDAYEQMSGTSMAAPQVTGMVALVAQYLRETGLPSGMSARRMAQSLLMSTAKPMLDADGYFYPVIQQGSGLANVGAAVTAHSYITVAGQPDGKVKVELGDDAARTGAYTFKFTLNNLTGEAAEYKLSADVFTQGLVSAGGYNFMNTSTNTLPATTTFSGSGVTDGKVTVPTNGSAEITATITLADSFKTTYNNYITRGLISGAYVEAYVWADEVAPAVADAEGVEPELTSHSIPVLGFYGNWSDASMYDKTSLNEYFYDVWDYPYLPNPNNPNAYNISTNYALINSKTEGEYVLGGNPMAEDLAESETWAEAYAYYLQEMGRTAMNNEKGDALSSIIFANIRNAGNAVFQVLDANTGDLYYRGNDLGPVTAAYYYANGGAWQSINKSLTLNWAGTKQVKVPTIGEDEAETVTEEPLPDGAQVLVQLVLAPEYYGTIPDTTTDSETSCRYSCDWDALTDKDGTLGDGAYLQFPLTIDNTPPQGISATRGSGEDANILTIKATDKNYIAAIAVYNENGTRLLAQVDPNIDPETGKDMKYEAGDEVTVEIDMNDAYGTRFYVAVYDYALNQATYVFSAAFTETNYDGTIILQDDAAQWRIYEGETEKTLKPLVESQVGFTAAAYVDGYIFGTDEEGNLYYAQQDNLDVANIITNIGVSFEDMTYNAADGLLYGIAYVVEGTSVYNYLYAVDKLTGEIEEVMDLWDIGLYDPTTIACDGEGTFYSIDNGDGHLYSYTLDCDEATDLGALDRRFNDAGTMEYDNGKLYWAHYVDEPPYFDVNGDGVTDAKDAQYILEYAVGNPLTELQTMYVEILGDFNGDGVSNTTDAQLLLTYINEPPMGDLVELTVTEDGVSTQPLFSLDGPMNVILFPKTYEEGFVPEWLVEAHNVATVVLDQDELDILVNETAQLTAYVTPWTLSKANKAVTWASSDEDVAKVDENGVVTGVGAGTAKITATSVVNGADGEKVTSEACTVTVSTIPYTLKGALQDEDGEAKLYTYDLETMPKPKYGVALSGARAIASTTLASDGNVYVADNVDGSYNVHKVGTDGADLDTYTGIGLPLCDIATSQKFTSDEGGDKLFSVYGPYFFIDDVDNMQGSGWNRAASLSSNTGASELVAVASAGGTYVLGDDVEIIYAVDDAGYMWTFLPFEYGESYSMYSGFEPIIFPGKKPSFQGYGGGANYCSLVAADDGYTLFLTVFNEESGSDGTSEIYMLTEWTNSDETEFWFEAKLAGNVGDGVWPATLYEATSNEEPNLTTMKLRDMVTAKENVILSTRSAEEMEENLLGIMQTNKGSNKTEGETGAAKFQSSLMDAVKNAEGKLGDAEQSNVEQVEILPNKGTADPKPVAPTPVSPMPIAPAPDAPMPIAPAPNVPMSAGGSLMSVSYTAERTSTSTVGVDVTATRSVNGLTEVTYDADVLTYEDVTENLPEGAIYAVNASKDGKVILAYASPTQVNGKIFRVNFSFDVDTSPYTTDVEIRTVEETDATAESTDSFTVRLKAVEVIIPPPPPPPPYVPETRPEPEPEPEPEPDVTVIVTDNDDGTTTTTVIDNETGASTATTELPDGSVVEKATDPDENVTITVTNPEGEVVVKVELPAETPALENHFEDVPEDDNWAHDAIHNMAALGIVNGVGDNQFDMEGPMTRGMLASILFRLSNGKAGYDMNFSDVDENEYYSDAVAWAAYTGVVKGVTEDTFAPDDAILREELVTMLYRYAKLLHLDTTASEDALNAFVDADEVSDWAQDAMAWCVENRIIFGVGDDTLDPAGTATRAQVATIFWRFMALMK